MTSSWKKTLRSAIVKKQAKVGIVGMGYVGSALAEIITRKGFAVVGFEKNEKKIHAINSRKNRLLHATSDTSRLSECDIVIVCVQTPIYDDKTPNLTFIEYATRELAQHLRKGQLIIIESSIHPGVTRKNILPHLQKASETFGETVFLGFSPERINPGTSFPLEKIPKVISGTDENSLELIKTFYKQLFSTVVPVSSLETAEMVKMFENTFRFINISLVNELKEYTNSIGVDIWEVIQAASTKPFGFLPHYPGPGIGGHCIPVDPFYLYHDAKKQAIELSLIKHAGMVNDNQPHKVVEQVLHVMQQRSSTKKYVKRETSNSVLPSSLRMYAFPEQLEIGRYVGVKGGFHKAYANHEEKYKILLIGIAYKPNIDDTRESPALKIWELFENLGHTVSYHDPYVAQTRGTLSVPLTEHVLDTHDFYVIVTNHSCIDYLHLATFGKPIFDTQHAYKNNFPNVYYV